jgi:hypothetical protein
VSLLHPRSLPEVGSGSACGCTDKRGPAARHLTSSARRERGTGPNQPREVSPEGWLVWSLALDDVLLRAEDKIMRVMATARLLLALLPALAGCATTSSDVGQVREVAPGTYKIGVAHSVTIGHDEENEAVDQAGKYCHAKGQKLVIVPSKDRDVTFRCGEQVTPGQ